MNIFSHWIKFGVIILAVFFFIFFLDIKFKENEKIARTERLESVHNHMLNQFSFSLDNFAGLVSGMNSFINLSKELPSAEEFQEFVRIQFRDINRQDSIVVSFIDTSHVFKFSFTPHQMDPANLIGKKVTSIREDKEIQNLNRLLSKDGLHLFPPINLVEGWPGLPLNFRVYRDGKVLGYVAPIIDFKSIIQPIYDDIEYDEFVFLFKNEEGQDFDRQQVYDGSIVYNTTKDAEYYKNFRPNSNNFLISRKTYFGYNLTLGTAFKDDIKPDNKFSIILWTSYFAFVILGLIITLQVGRYKALNSKLTFTNNLLEERQIKIDQQNKELIQLNKTKDKFFSIIGHDIKQPLNAIEGLLHLLEDSEIKDSSLSEILKELSQATSNTVDLLNNLLRWALTQTGDIKFNKTPLDLTKIVQKSIEIVKPQAENKGIKFVQKIEENITLNGDGDMIQTIVRNLVSNATKFSNANSIVEIHLDKDDNQIGLKIKDYGVGMTPQQVDELFHLDKVISREGTAGEAGTGLGLKLTKDFIQLHKGKLKISSELGKGTIFKVFFPAE